eukprot:TRINITY_DN67257_c0_g1_i1.p1 TRINITY_DN67257_c0_g1~~TRINITY_DN67257_c0_g1_i1.p1  ORF type:complete len:287 (+),score=37.29 TRINITY_DN67257_c0_g1_i1:23-862(+)
MCAVKHTVYDPRQLQLATRRGGAAFFDVPSQTRSAPASRCGRPKSLPQGRALQTISECGSPRSEAASAGGGRHSAVAVRGGREEPWRSAAVADFASGLGTGSLEALMLQGPRGTALRAVGEAADHQVASRTVADIEGRRQQVKDGPSVDLAEGMMLDSGKRRNAVRRGSDLALAVPNGAQRQATSFGAVYEYRDSCGTAKVVASTNTMPERQFALDQRQHEDVLSKHRDPSLVWVGISGGRGGLSEAEMTEVRRSVVSARADRLQAQKLADIKPYSRHG